MNALTIQLPDDLRVEAETLARSTGRTLDEVPADAVAQGLAYDRWIREQEGRPSAREEPLVPADEV